MNTSIHDTKRDNSEIEAPGAASPLPAPPCAGASYTPPAIVYRSRLEAVAADCLAWPGKAMGICSVGNS